MIKNGLGAAHLQLPVSVAQRGGSLEPGAPLEPIIEQLRAEGQRCDDELLSLTTPLLRRHINPFGRYHFDLARMRRDGDSLAKPTSEASTSERAGP
jgi:hypothetical protein